MEKLYEILTAVAKKLCPSSKRIAKNAAKKVQKSYNGIDASKRVKVSEYANKAMAIGKYGEELRQMIDDGNIDDIERDRLAEIFTPIVEAGKSLVFG